MSLNLKNPETLQLAATVARRRGVSQVRAITDALADQLAALDRPPRRVDTVLAAIWAGQTSEENDAVRQRVAGLYDEAGLPA